MINRECENAWCFRYVCVPHSLKTFIRHGNILQFHSYNPGCSESTPFPPLRSYPPTNYDKWWVCKINCFDADDVLSDAMFHLKFNYLWDLRNVWFNLSILTFVFFSPSILSSVLTSALSFIPSTIILNMVYLWPIVNWYLVGT